LLYHHSSENTVGYKPQFRIVKVIITQIAATDSSRQDVDLWYLSCFKETKEFIEKRGASAPWNCSVQNDCERSNLDARNARASLAEPKLTKTQTHLSRERDEFAFCMWAKRLSQARAGRSHAPAEESFRRQSLILSLAFLIFRLERE